MFCANCKNEFEEKKKSDKFCSKKCCNNFWARKSYWNNHEKRLAYSRKPEVKKKDKLLHASTKYKTWRNSYLKNKRKTDIIFRLKHSILDRERQFRKIKHSKLEEYLGYKLQDLIDKLIPEELVEKYMNRELELDHIIPYGNFIILEGGDQEFKKCWNLRNLRLISSTENRKRNKLNYFKDVIDNKIEDLLPLGPKELWEKIKSYQN